MKYNDIVGNDEKKYIEIAYCFDNNYKQHFGASLTSILLNEEVSDFTLRFHVITNVADRNLSDKISRLAHKFNIEINFYKIDLNRLSGINNLPINSKFINHTTIFTWVRLFLAEIIPSNISKVIYLDSDTIVLTSLRELYLTDMKGAAVAGCLDLNHKELADRLRIDKYVNAGVLLIDLDQWRQYDYTTRCIEHTQTIHENIIFADQCAINIFFSDRIEILDPKWNFYVTPSINLDDLRGKSILHYISAQKPWQVNYNPKNSRYYWRYLEVSPWRDIESSRLQPDNKADGLEQTTVHPRSILPKLLAIYRSVGLEPLTGYNPLHFSSWEAAPFTKFVCNGQLVGVSGLALQEVMFLEGLSGLTHPASVLVIGNALGWSAVALSLIFPQARILTLDPDTQGNSITNKIAQIHHLKISAVTGISPDDIPSILHNKSNTSLDLCLIDAIHENENLRNDFAAIYHHLSPGAMVLMHDVIDWNMMIAFEEILRKPGISGRLLTRTASGMGLVWKSDISPTLLDYISSFTESAELYKGYQTIVRQSLLKKSEAAVNHYR